MSEKLKLIPGIYKKGRSIREQRTVDFGTIEKIIIKRYLCNKTIVRRSFNVKWHFEIMHMNIFSFSAEEKRETFQKTIK